VGKYYSKPKTMWGNIVTIHSVLKKKTTKQNSQPAQYEKNKINKDHFGKKRRKKFIKKRKKIMQGNIVIIHNVRKKYRTKFSTSSI